MICYINKTGHSRHFQQSTGASHYFLFSIEDIAHSGYLLLMNAMASLTAWWKAAS